MKRLNHRKMTRDELVSYANKLESALFEVHNLFWFEIGVDGVVRPVARIPVGAEERLTYTMDFCRNVVNKTNGENVIRLRSKRKRFAGRLVTAMAIMLLMIVLSSVALDILSSCGSEFAIKAF